MTPAERIAQRDAALRSAHRTKTARAELRRAIAAGTRSVADVLRDPPDEALSMPVGRLLATQHRWGPGRVAEHLAPLHVNELRKVGDLTDRQRHAIADCLDLAPVEVRRRQDLERFAEQAHAAALHDDHRLPLPERVVNVDGDGRVWRVEWLDGERVRLVPEGPVGARGPVPLIRPASDVTSRRRWLPA